MKSKLFTLSNVISTTSLIVVFGFLIASIINHFMGDEKIGFYIVAWIYFTGAVGCFITALLKKIL